MFRARIAVLGVAAYLGMASGCMNLSWPNVFHRNRDCCPTDSPCCGAEGMMGSDGPVLGDYGPMAPAGPGGNCQNTYPQNNVPSLGPTPRLVPQPNTQAPMSTAPPR